MDKPKYSKNEIEKAGKLIISCDEINDFYNETLEIVEHWRDAHVEPTNEMLKICKKSISGLSNPVCVSRMKRTETIIDKLNRHKDKHLQLQKFDDIGGCRIIVDNIEDVYKVLGNLSKYDMHKKPSDYIKNPKKWGYRCIHVHHRFNSDGFCYDNLRIETQIRTTFQHAWATAVEVLDVIDNTNYKFGVGDEDVLTFFALFSNLIATLEKQPLIEGFPINVPDIIFGIKAIEEKFHILQKLINFRNSIFFYDEKLLKGNKGYYLVELNAPENCVSTQYFTKEEESKAVEEYKKLEHKKEDGIYVLLARTDSINELKVAYPNYFSDITTFLYLAKEVGIISKINY